MRLRKVSIKNHGIGKEVDNIKNTSVRHLLLNNYHTIGLVSPHYHSELVRYAVSFEEGKSGNALFLARAVVKLEQKIYARDVRKILGIFLKAYPHIQSSVYAQLQYRFPTSLVARHIATKHNTGRNNSA